MRDDVPTKMKEWLLSAYSSDIPLVDEWEISYIEKRWEQVKNNLPPIIHGSLETNSPVDIILLIKDKHWTGNDKHVPLSHFLRPCPCEECGHDWQIECYYEDCQCEICYERCT